MGSSARFEQMETAQKILDLHDRKTGLIETETGKFFIEGWSNKDYGNYETMCLAVIETEQDDTGTYTGRRIGYIKISPDGQVLSVPKEISRFIRGKLYVS